MNMTLIMAAVVLILLLCVIGAAAYGISRLKRGIRDFSRQVFGTDSLKEGFDRVEEEYQETPKSVSAMTGLYLPKIKKDFPQFQYDDMRVRAENVLTSYLMAVSAADQGFLKEGSQELRDQLEMKIVQQKNSGKENILRRSGSIGQRSQITRKGKEDVLSCFRRPCNTGIM